MSRVRKINTGDVLLDRYHPNDAERLLRFNITKQRIVDLCNKDFEDDPFDEAKNYSTWHRAMDGQEVWEGIVHALNGLYEDQTARPRQYLPQDDPGDDLSEWMAQIAKATWWHKTLQLDMPLNSLNSWFSGRVSKTRPELREKVDAWWASVKAAVDEAERYSSVLERDRNKDGNMVMTWDTWVNDLLEDGVSIENARAQYIDEGLLHDLNHLKLIDLTNSMSPLSTVQKKGEYEAMYRAMREQEFDTLHKAGFPKAVSRTPSEFDAAPFIKESQWGDRRNEECPKDLNTHLYGKRYRERCQRYWDDQERRVDVTTEIVEVSTDGENWREPNETEKKGWDNGIIFFFEAIHADQDASNSYTQELEQAKRAVKRARSAYDQGTGDPKKEASLYTAVKVTELALQRAQDNTHGQYD